MSNRCRYYTSLILFVTLGLSLGACHEGRPQAVLATPSTDKSANRLSQKRYGIVTRTAGYDANSAAPVAARSFAALMQQLKAPEQTRAREWYHRIGGPSMTDATPAQIAWMDARGYPMPEDITRAASMSKTELKAAAANGDITAQVLYAASLLEGYNRLYGSINGPSDPARFSDPNRFRLLDEINRTMLRVLASGSPFAGYLFAARHRLMYPGDDTTNTAIELAGLVWACKFGDTRASLLLNDPKTQAVDATTAGAAMNLMLKNALRANPRLFSTTVAPIPPSNH